MKKLTISHLFSMLLAGTVVATGCVQKAGNHQLSKENNNSLIGDGKTDNTAQFRKFFETATEGATLQLPEGTFLITDALLLDKPGITIKGKGQGTILKFTGNKDVYGEYRHRTGMFNVMADNITISDMKFDQNFRGSGRQDGANPQIGCIIIGYFNNDNHPVYGTIVQNCEFYDYYGDAVAGHQARTSNLKVIGNKFYSAYEVGKWKTAGTKGEQAVSVYIGDNITITNNEIYGALDDAIAILFKVNNCVISENKITTTGGRITVNGCKNCEVRNNDITYIEDGSSAIMVSFGTTRKVLGLNSNVKIIKNKIIVNPGININHAILIAGAGENITVEENEVINNGGTIKSGVYVTGRMFEPGAKKKPGTAMNRIKRKAAEQQGPKEYDVENKRIGGSENEDEMENSASGDVKERSNGAARQLITPKGLVISNNKIVNCDNGVSVGGEGKEIIRKNIRLKENSFIKNGIIVQDTKE